MRSSDFMHRDLCLELQESSRFDHPYGTCTVHCIDHSCVKIPLHSMTQTRNEFEYGLLLNTTPEKHNTYDKCIFNN